jgi:four helix bundle protein
MFLQLKHVDLEIYKATRRFTLECYQTSKLLPVDERFNMTQQLRRAALSVHLNLAEGCSRKTAPDRRRFYEISRDSVVEIDALLDVAFDLDYLLKEQIIELGKLLVQVFKLLSGMIDNP